MRGGRRGPIAIVVLTTALGLFASGCVDGKTPDCSAEAGVSCGPDFDGNFPEGAAGDGGDGGDGGGPVDAPSGDVRDAPAGDAPGDAPSSG